MSSLTFFTPPFQSCMPHLPAMKEETTITERIKKKKKDKLAIERAIYTPKQLTAR